MQVHARGRTHLGHLVHPKATDLQMEYSSANQSLYDPYKQKSPSGSEDPRMEPAEAAAEAKEREKGWNAKTSGNAGRNAGSSSCARSGFLMRLRDPPQELSEGKRLSCLKMPNVGFPPTLLADRRVGRPCPSSQPGQERGLNRGAPGANDQS